MEQNNSRALLEMALSSGEVSIPSSSPRSRSREIHRRPSSLNKSPVNLPIRPELSFSAVPESSQSHVKGSLSPRHASSPRRSSYSEKSIPVTGFQGSISPQRSTKSPIPDSMHQVGLIFDDSDERLSPPEVSSRQQINADAKIAAVSSQKVGGDTETQIAQTDGDVFDYSLASGEDAGDCSLGDYSYGENQQLSAAFPLDSVSVSALPHMDLQNMTAAALYPTPLPSVLMRPPILSKKNIHHNNRPQTLNALTSMQPPRWKASPLEGEIQFLNMADTPNLSHPGGLTSFCNQSEDDVSDVDSDRATIMSGDEDEFHETPLEGLIEKFESRTDTRGGKGRSWVSKMFFKKDYNNLGASKDEIGESYDGEEAEELNSQMVVLNSETAFFRLDPETIQRHSQMFNAGGLHNTITPRSGGPTSLIEELEIRKAGKKVQQQVFFREINEIERQRVEDSSKLVHPADLVYNVQPTLLQMQQMAETDYQVRVQWHKREINKNYIQENGSETLAQRRARLRAQKTDLKTEGGAQETLAQRRQRLRNLRQLQSSEPDSCDCDISSEQFPSDTGHENPASLIEPTVNSVSEVY